VEFFEKGRIFPAFFFLSNPLLIPSSLHNILLPVSSILYQGRSELLSLMQPAFSYLCNQ
jgi:hypothetical protein